MLIQRFEGPEAIKEEGGLFGREGVACFIGARALGKGGQLVDIQQLHIVEQPLIDLNIDRVIGGNLVVGFIIILTAVDKAPILLMAGTGHIADAFNFATATGLQNGLRLFDQVGGGQRRFFWVESGLLHRIFAVEETDIVGAAGQRKKFTIDG